MSATKTCHGIHLWEFEEWVRGKVDALSKIENKTATEINELESLNKVLEEIKGFLND